MFIRSYGGTSNLCNLFFWNFPYGPKRVRIYTVICCLTWCLNYTFETVLVIVYFPFFFFFFFFYGTCSSCRLIGKKRYRDFRSFSAGDLNQSLNPRCCLNCWRCCACVACVNLSLTECDRVAVYYIRYSSCFMEGGGTVFNQQFWGRHFLKVFTFQNRPGIPESYLLFRHKTLLKSNQKVFKLLHQEIKNSIISDTDEKI